LKVAAVKSQTYAVTEAVPARIAETPQTDRPLVAPIGGVVQAITPVLGQTVTSGDTVVTILRDALPRPSLVLTEDLLKPATEGYHQVKGELRKALKSVEILDSELSRLAKVGGATVDGLSILPKQTQINLKYEKSKVEQDVANLRLELKLHGLSEAQVKKVEAGEEVDLNLQIWKAVLRRNGIWSERADAVLAILPAEKRDRPWVIATIGELQTQDLLTSELQEWLSHRSKATAYFIHVAGLLLQGESLESIKRLEELGALAPVVKVAVPADAPDWDVHSLLVRTGQHVDAGQSLLVLSNPRRVYLEANPVGHENIALLKALESGHPLSAVPLIGGDGPNLDDLKLQTLSGGDDGRSVARAVVNNQVGHTTKGDGRDFRSWRLRTGQRYMLRIPTRVIHGVVVVPAAAIAEDGVDRIVYVQKGDAYSAAKVVIEYSDHEVAVLGVGSELKAGDRVVTSGTFQIHLAARAAAGGGAVDPHHGHAH
jgi:multidrug efflux pump subunit AcrA (membrane-fusion protein)